MPHANSVNTNKLAKTSLILGAFSVVSNTILLYDLFWEDYSWLAGIVDLLYFFGLIAGMIGIFLGFIAIVQISLDWRHRRGILLAICGIIASCPGIFVFAGSIDTGPGKKGLDAAVRADLQQLRNAIEQFHTDTKVYPARLVDLVHHELTLPPSGGNVGSTKVPAGGCYQGPYMPPNGGINGKGLPINPYIGTKDAKTADHWKYDPATGKVSCPATITGSTWDGVPYSSL
jgi:hypothetical protein